jgi:hypothetical protein
MATVPRIEPWWLALALVRDPEITAGVAVWSQVVNAGLSAAGGKLPPSSDR